MSTSWSDILSAVLDVVADPTSNLTAAVTLMAAAVLVVLILVILAMILVLSGGARRRGRQSETSPRPVKSPESSEVSEVTSAPRAQRSSIARWLGGRGGTWLSVAAAVAILLSAYVTTSQDSYCLTCHADGLHAAGETEGAHADVSCVRCHEDTWSIAGNTMARLADVAAHYGLGSSQYSSSMRSSRCLGCHERHIAETTENEQTGVRVSHAEPLDAGWACADCHTSEQHADMAAAVGMSPCLSCHDAQTASAECDTCHTKDTSAASGLAGKRIYGTATITRADCEGCHSMESCDACHGIRMPHSDEFLRTHPRYSGFDKKELCFEQCHTQADCGKCHGAWSSHIPSFKEDHKRLPKTATCNTCHDQHEGPMCDLCHDFNTQPTQ